MLKRHRLLTVIKAVLVIAVLAAGALAFDSYLDPFDDLPFDPTAWAAAEETWQGRGPMARAAARRVPPGTPADKVRELLGNPCWEANDNPPDKWGRPCKGYSRWTYWLGCWSGLSWYGYDSASLDIHFDRDGRVAEVEITGG